MKNLNVPKRVIVTGGSGFIGTNLVESLLLAGIAVQSLDIKPPQNDSHRPWHRCCDILDRPRLERLISDFEADALVHLAARTDLVETGGLEAYAVNVQGVTSVLQAINRTLSVKRVLFTSSKLVNKNGAIADHTTAYNPDTLYGQSKVLGEQIVRDAPPNCVWSIVRPTSIWGPWFGAPYRKFFRVVANRLYFHMAGCDLPKRFGYVGNCVSQINSLLTCSPEQVNGQTFYLADYDITTIREWSDDISMHLRQKRNHFAPDWILEATARVGDFAKLLGIAEPPLSSFRLQNMRTPTADVPLDNMKRILHSLPFSQKQGDRITLEWLGYKLRTTDQ
jgi:nucleoside-diphosphate-sugar epimerase